jgi:threonylcarbamoyladenosine tRNA methylthiotransferase MtaB
LTGVHLGDYGDEETGRGGEGETGRRGDEETGRGGEGETGRQEDRLNGLMYLPVSPSSLASLVRRITNLDGDFRIRLSSIEAAEVTSELIGVMAARRDRICPHLHLPLQSGSDAVLRRMNRRGSVEEFVARCHAIRAALDRPALTTDVIVGFPGETDEDFAATCRIVEEVGFAKVHVFRFSPRQGTPAARMGEQVPGRIAMRRATRLGKLSKTLRMRYFRELLGRPLQVLVEGTMPGRPGWMGGTSDYHAPVAVPGGPELLGQFACVIGERVENGWIWGRPNPPGSSCDAV